MKQRKYPLWMLKLLYSRFASPMRYSEIVTSKNWRNLGIDLDGDVITAKRRFSKHIDKITIDVINSKTFIIINRTKEKNFMKLILKENNLWNISN